MKIRERLAVNLRRLRKERHLSQETLARHAGIDRTSVSAIERSVHATNVDVLERLASVLDVEAAELLVGPIIVRRRDSSPQSG